MMKIDSIQTTENSRSAEGSEAVVLIPAYQPDGTLVKLLRSCLEAGISEIVVVNDGSSPDRAEYFREAETMGVRVCCHEANRGKGAAIKTGLRYVQEHLPSAAGVVTADADGQHAVSDILALTKELRVSDSGITLGVRSFDTDDVPWNSRAGNRITAGIFRLITGVKCPDTQTGLRGIPASLIPVALSVEGERYDYEMNLLIEVAKRGLPIHMVPIQTIYLDNNSSSHFRVVRDSYLIYKRPLTFLMVSLFSSGTDLLAFYLFLRFLFSGQNRYILIATVIARILSGVVNFVLNKKVTFRSRGSWGAESTRYLILFVAAMLLSGGLVSLLSVIPLPTVVIKIIVDTGLFVMNYYVEKLWVFRDHDPSN